MTRNWFLDTNLVAVWAMARGGVLDHLQASVDLPDVLVDAYRVRFRNQLRLFDVIDAHVQRGGTDQFFVSTLALNELFQAVKNETLAVLSFQDGVPVSQWRNRLNNRRLDETRAHGIVDATLHALAELQEHHHMQVIAEKNAVNDDAYWNVYGPMLFLVEHAGTMDTTLAVTALLHGADAFISEDQRFRKAFRAKYEAKTGMRVLSAQQATTELRS